jgi:hypothetical protein
MLELLPLLVHLRLLPLLLSWRHHGCSVCSLTMGWHHLFLRAARHSCQCPYCCRSWHHHPLLLLLLKLPPFLHPPPPLLLLYLPSLCSVPSPLHIRILCCLG